MQQREKMIEGTLDYIFEWGIAGDVLMNIVDRMNKQNVELARDNIIMLGKLQLAKTVLMNDKAEDKQKVHALKGLVKDVEVQDVDNA